ncbi:DNA-binding protein [Pseudomonas sp. NA-150]|uniref:DNA-binding protein n=1 Tax=Pseudomonas sp. NA-150 TaxID=3367525 RepID=UPI0037C68162
MARGGVNKAVVQTARMALLARGDHPSIDAVRIEMGNTGSKTTIHRYLKELDEADSRRATPPIEIGDELSELVSRLSQRLQEQAQETVEQAREVFDSQQEELRQTLALSQLHLADLQQKFAAQSEVLNSQNQALEHTRQTLHAEQTLTARLLQAQQDLELRVQDKDGQIRSLEEKHLHARDALEHYRNAIKEQREQEQRRHEGQLQQVQMELRQAQQSAMVRQDEITQLNRDNERLLSETRSTLRELQAREDQLSKSAQETTRLSKRYQSAQAHLEIAQLESERLQTSLSQQQQSHQALHVELIKTQLTLEQQRAAAVTTQEDNTHGEEASTNDANRR